MFGKTPQKETKIKVKQLGSNVKESIQSDMNDHQIPEDSPEGGHREQFEPANRPTRATRHRRRHTSET